MLNLSVHPFQVIVAGTIHASYSDLLCAFRTVDYIRQDSYVRCSTTGEIWDHVTCIHSIPSRPGPRLELPMPDRIEGVDVARLKAEGKLMC